MRGFFSWIAGILLFCLVFWLSRALPFPLAWQGSLGFLVGGLMLSSVLGLFCWFNRIPAAPAFLPGTAWPPLLILVTQKNEAERVAQSALGWLGYSQEVQVWVCDDHSEHDPVLAFSECQSRFPQRFGYT